MALWKPFRGNHTDLNSVEKHDGYVYFCVDDAALFFDYTDANGVLQRKQISAKDAETLTGVSLDEIKKSINYNDLIGAPTLGTLASKNEITKADLSTDLQETIDRASEAPRVVSRSISLPAANWTGNASPYSQVVSIAEATETSRIDLYPTLDQVISLSANGIALTMVNDNAVVTAYALNGKPTVDYDIQIVILDAVNITNAEGVSF